MERSGRDLSIALLIKVSSWDTPVPLYFVNPKPYPAVHSSIRHDVLPPDFLTPPLTRLKQRDCKLFLCAANINVIAIS